VKTKIRWIIGGAIIATLVAACSWLVLTDAPAPAHQFLVLSFAKIFIHSVDDRRCSRDRLRNV